jgi:hypothetical protein
MRPIFFLSRGNKKRRTETDLKSVEKVTKKFTKKGIGQKILQNSNNSGETLFSITVCYLPFFRRPYKHFQPIFISMKF